MRCGCGTPLAGKSRFFSPSSGFYSLQNISSFHCSLRHVFTSKEPKKLPLKRRNTATHGRGGWDALKKFFPAFPRGRKNTSYFAFWQQQQSRLSLCDWSTGQQWNKVEWHIIHMRGLWLDKKTTWCTWLVPWMAFPAKKLAEKARINSLSIMVNQQAQEKEKFMLI